MEGFFPLLTALEVIFLKPVFVQHSSYQQFVLEQLDTHYSGPILVLRNKDWPLIAKLWVTDLSYINTLLAKGYGDRGPKPRDPASLMRCYLVFLMTKPTIGLTEWVEELHRIPLYAIISGFEPGDVPGVGTFYDFFDRLWKSSKKDVKPKRQKRKKKPKKGKKKGQKAPTTTTGKVKRLIKWMTRGTATMTHLPTDTLFHFFESQILTVSAELGLLGNTDALRVAGDGTPVATSAYPRSKPACNCSAQGHTECNHARVYSQPDCNIGWDSSRERHYHGYNLYMLSASDSHYDLPLYPKLQRASRHDSVSLVMSAVEFQQRSTLGTIDKMLLDAAHDAQSIYEMLDDQGIEPIIDLNERGKKNTQTGGNIAISPAGIPICPAGLEMKPNGYDHTQDRQKWRCSLACNTKNSCENPCSNAKYGRTFHTHSKDNLRLYPKTIRGSQKWKLIFKRRTSVERSNKREKVDYKLETGRHRSTKMWYMRLYGIMICQHVDAWYAVQQESLSELKTVIYPAVA